MPRHLEIQDFLHSGQRWYQSWQGVPFHDHHFAPLLDWINFYGNPITSTVPFNITEIGPNGGRFTFTVLRQLQQLGMPRSITYTIYGSDAERTLTQRDGLQPFNKQCTFGNVARVRTHAKVPPNPTNLITEIEFKGKSLSELKLSGPPQNIILCLDSFHSFTKEEQERIFSYIRYNLIYSGTLIFSVPTRIQLHYTDRLKQNLTLLGMFKIDDTTYCGYTNNTIS